jgi:hypothetical protein
MSNGYVRGTPVENPPAWLRMIAPNSKWLYLEYGVCDICEIHGAMRWQTARHGYVYCRSCIEREHEERGLFAGWVLLGP